jgi:putative ABC transport system ATP-binding protein
MNKTDDGVVALEGVTKVYSKGLIQVKALGGIDLHVPQGEYLAIMGASGSGKSTLLNLLGCLDQPTSGAYRLGGVDISNMDDDALSAIRNQRIGFVFQSFNLIEQLSVVENIEIPLFYAQVSPGESRRRGKELAERVGLGDRMHHRPSELSGGQMQRVALARALVNEPMVILADEPTGNLDSRTEDEVLDLIDEMNASGKTIIMVTHDDHVAERAHRVIHLFDGLIDREVHNVRP